MIKRIVTICLTVLILTMAAQAQVKIAVVDLKRSFDEYYKTKDAEALLKDRLTGIEKELQEYKDDYQKMVDEINKLKEAVQDKTLSQAARDDKQKALDTKLQDAYNQDRKLQEFQMQRQHQFDDQKRRMLQSIVDEILKVVNDIGARDKYSLVIDKSAASVTGTPILLYSQDVKDITDDVIKAINATKPTGGTDAAATPAAAPASTPAPTPAPAH